MSSAAPRIRLFVDAPLAVGAAIEASVEQAHYLGTVMRLGAGDAVALFNGADGEWRARIDGASRRRVTLAVDERLRPQAPEPGPCLAFAPLKKTAVDFVVEKATELGVAALVPVLTRRTNAERVNLRRLRARAVEAAEQCGRLTVPEIRDPAPLDRVCAEWPRERRLLVLDETGGGRPLVDVLAEAPDAHGLLVGPEGGFQPSELDALRAMPFVTAVGLGPRTLRAETAAVAAIACWQALVGDWRTARS